MDRKARLSLERIVPRLKASVFEADASAWEPFQRRLEANFERLFDLLLNLYGEQYDFFYHLESVLETAARIWLARPLELKALDAEREADLLWFQNQEMLGGVCYVDLFAGDLEGVRAKIPYFRELGLTYLHLMPLFLSPTEENDGGYAVSSYREVDPSLGTVQQLRDLATELRHNGISLVLDFVYNHTSDEHAWARCALAGDVDYQAYYLIFPDRQMPDAYEAHLREIFPEARRGNFTYRQEIDSWVWTTFHSFQWDLNYRNPVVFDRMAEEALFLANIGVEVLRLDAVAFTWKELGTNCENLPQAHKLIQALNALARIAAPALLLKSEAIVHPDDVARYIGPNECQLSYNPTLMALLWEALATRQVRLLRYSMEHRFRIDPGCAWVNYVRCHDDIGWTFSDEDAAALGINGFDHRQFLNAFYTGRFEGSFARGLPFQFNPTTQDMRISGTCASLAGLEKALHEETQTEVELAIRRILLIHSVILSIGGIPLIYLGDEVGTLNDYSYREDPARADDSRWVHRPAADWAAIERRNAIDTVAGQIYTRLRRLIEIRKSTLAFGGGDTEIIDIGNTHVFGYVRKGMGTPTDTARGRVLVLANFTEDEQLVEPNELRLHGLGYAFSDLVTGQEITADEHLVLDPYRFVWLIAVHVSAQSIGAGGVKLL
jgi:amylosucrase